jgi:hypothetical protein
LSGSDHITYDFRLEITEYFTLVTFTHLMKNIMLVFGLMCLVQSVTAGDHIRLRNGNLYDGKVKKVKKCRVVFEMNNDTYEIPAHEIQYVQFADVNDRVYTRYQKKVVDDNACFKGQTDAVAYHGKGLGHAVLGFLFGPFAVIGTAVTQTTPDRGKSTYLMSQNKELFDDPVYINCYKKKAKGKLIGAELGGLALAILIAVIASP